MFTRETDRKIKRTLILGSFWLVAVICNIYFLYSTYVRRTGLMPDEPVVFSHKAHIEKYDMKCLYCHTSAEKSAFSSVPSTSNCMICHIALRAETDKMKPVVNSFENLIPIKWNRIYRLPDYVRFNHSRHIRAMIDCSSCHGEVEKMEKVYQVRALTMKWCLDCHRNPGKFIIPARPVSGIFTLKDIKNSNSSYIAVTYWPVTDPPYGEWITELTKPELKGIPVPKKAGRASETCSSCHY